MAKRKNVILILSDQQRMDTIGAYGCGLGDIVKTPHIDQLAAEGMKFTNAYTTSAICAPARASVMTGLYPHKHGVIDNFTDIVEGTHIVQHDHKGRLLHLPERRKVGTLQLFYCQLSHYIILTQIFLETRFFSRRIRRI